MPGSTMPPGFQDLLEFPLLDALLGRRSRRFFLGAEITDGVMAHRSRHQPLPLTELETMLVLLSMSGTSGWHNLIFRHPAYAPHLSNYAGAAGGRTFPSAAGFHTSQIFYTDDSGVYMVDSRDAPPLAERDADGRTDPEAALEAFGGRVIRLQEGRLDLPPEVPHVEGHNTWVANAPGSLLAIPVGDLAQHVLLNIMYMLQNDTVLFDDINGRSVPGIEGYADLVDVNNVWPLSFMESLSLAEVTAELSTACFAGSLMLQAMGLGGWLFNGLNPFSVLGAEAPQVRGLGFDFQTDERWPTPNVTGLPGVMEAFCPPNHPDMRTATDALCERKFGQCGPYHPETPGPFQDTAKVRGAAAPHNERFRECVALQAQYVLDTFGKFPGTVPSVYVLTYLQAHHLDLEFYDEKFKPGAYLRTHKNHMERWHGE
ncbi:hypothetical protein [Desulfohalovibrio reitneri]|uniref:hypothetical protein n=1 Tax=Desulfohalovibrio reitneri TaxID=1307759 RepID=UPI0004A6D76A|nr:hypothetical protein [Desulfohalovibrio reitneri]